MADYHRNGMSMIVEVVLFDVKLLAVDLGVWDDPNDSSVICWNPYFVAKVICWDQEDDNGDEKWQLESKGVPKTATTGILVISAIEGERKRADDPDESQLPDNDALPNPFGQFLV